MRMRLFAGVVAAAAAAVLVPMSGTASACTDTLDRVVVTGLCNTKCPPPTYPRAAVYVDGHWVIVCA